MKRLVIFGQDLENCAPCKQYEPVVLKLIELGVEVERHEAFTPEGEHNPLNKQYGVMTTPTTIIFEGDKEVDRFGGPRPLSFLRKILEF